MKHKKRPLGHEFRPNAHRAIKVWVDVDRGIAKMVIYLNTIKGVRTHTSCQGTIGEGGPHPYGPFVECSFSDKALIRVRKEFEVKIKGKGWGYVHPKEEEKKKFSFRVLQ